MLKRVPSKKESKLGGFLRGLRPASPKAGAKSKLSLPSDVATTERESRRSTRTLRRARSRSRPRAKSAGGIPDETPESPRKTPPSDSTRRRLRTTNDLRLRSKSPSRQRIEEFMNELKAREMSASGERVLSQESPTSRSPTKDRRPPSATWHDRQWSRDRNFEEGDHASSARDASSARAHAFMSNSGRSAANHRRSTSGERLSSPIERKLVKSPGCRSQTTMDSSLHNPSRDNFLVELSPSQEGDVRDRYFSSSVQSNTLRNTTATSTNRSPGANTPTEARRSLFKRSSTVKESDSPDCVRAMLDTKNPQAWFSAIIRRDWERVELLIQDYDYKKYASTLSKPQKKLRVLKLLPTSNANGLKVKQECISPLLAGDSKGRTPLHVGCKEYMPWRLLQSIFFLERSVAYVLDDDDRLPIHLAVIANHDYRILDRLIRGNPDALLHPDAITGRTPLGYAILRADYKRDKIASFTSWRKPLSEEESGWQNEQVQNWKNVNFLLETFVLRRKVLSKSYESQLPLECARGLAPPSVMNHMLSLSARILQHDPDMAERILKSLVACDYPTDTIRKALKVCSKIMPLQLLIDWMRRAMVEQYEKGRISWYREEFHMKTSFRNEVIQTYKRMARVERLCLTSACQEWWDKLKFLIGYSAMASLAMHELDELYLLHAACMVPDSPIHLIELLVRLFPAARSAENPQNGSLPIHMIIKYRKGESQNEEEMIQILNLVVGGDVSLARQRYLDRAPLHHALLGRHSWSFVKTIILMNPEDVKCSDPWTRLYPFQLAAMKEPTFVDDEHMSEYSNRRYDDPETTIYLDTVFEILRLNPTAINPSISYGRGDPKGDLGPVAQHVLGWCYSFRNEIWALDRTKLKILRSAIGQGEIPVVLREWYDTMKTLIWRDYDLQNTGKRIVYMPHEDSFLLHAALSNGRTHPIAIELLLELFPASVTTPKPGTQEYPIHIAAKSPSYAPMPFETVISMPSAFEMIVLAYPRAVKFQLCGRNVLQMIIHSGKAWNDMKPVLDTEPTFIGIRDPWTGLFPYQHVAAQESTMPLITWIHSKTFATEWSGRTPRENGRFLVDLRSEYDCRILSTIYEMVRRTCQ